IIVKKWRKLVEIAMVHRLYNIAKGFLKRDKVREIFYLVLEPFSLNNNLHAIIVAVQGLGSAVVMVQSMSAGKFILNYHFIHGDRPQDPGLTMLEPLTYIDSLDAGKRLA